jgi:hypothetical protein
VATHLLLDQDWSGVEEVPLLSSEDLSFNDMAEIMSELLGKEVGFQQIPFEAFKARFVEFGMSEAKAQGMSDMAAAKSEDLDNAVKCTPENSTPTSSGPAEQLPSTQSPNARLRPSSPSTAACRRCITSTRVCAPRDRSVAAGPRGRRRPGVA